jgi:hypothetical protein
MNAKSSGSPRQTVSRLPKRAIEPDQVEQTQTDEEGRNHKRQTLYLPFGVHEQLREVAFQKRLSMQEVVRQALDMWFADNGLPSWDEAKKAWDAEKRGEQS